jgi:hypothetical protein
VQVRKEALKQQDCISTALWLRWECWPTCTFATNCRAALAPFRYYLEPMINWILYYCYNEPLSLLQFTWLESMITGPYNVHCSYITTTTSRIINASLSIHSSHHIPKKARSKTERHFYSPFELRIAGSGNYRTIFPKRLNRHLRSSTVPTHHHHSPPLYFLMRR